MKAFLSLRWKLLGWFLVNLAVIGAVLYVYMRAQFRFGLDSLLAGPTGDRLETLAQGLIAELQQTPAPAPADALARATALWREKGVQAALFRTGSDFAEFAAGDFQEMPDVIRDRLKNQDRGPGPGRGRPNREGRPSDDERDGPGGPPPMPDGQKPPPGDDGPPPEFGDRPPRRSDSGRTSFGPSRPGPGGKFILTSEDPRLYWAGVRLGSLERGTGGNPRPPLTLLLRSGSMRGGGLFFDYYPLLAVGGGLLAVSVLLWLPMVGRLTGALGKLTRSAEAIAQGRFDAPPELKRHDELGRLNSAHRHMAGKLTQYVEGQQRFLGDTAHELLSPLARLEVALSILEQRTGPEDQRYVARALEETHRMTALLHELLSFTKARLGGVSVSRATVALAPMVRDIAARESASHVPADVRLDIPEDHFVSADPALLDRAIANGLRNALRYAGGDGPVEVSSRRDKTGPGLTLTIADHGPGVPPELLGRLFDPFFRPDLSRVRETGGTGLGLAIVKSAVEACGGSVRLENRSSGGLALIFHLLPAVEGSPPIVLSPG